MSAISMFFHFQKNKQTKLFYNTHTLDFIDLTTKISSRETIFLGGLLLLRLDHLFCDLSGHVSSPFLLPIHAVPLNIRSHCSHGAAKSTLPRAFYTPGLAWNTACRRIQSDAQGSFASCVTEHAVKSKGPNQPPFCVFNSK